MRPEEYVSNELTSLSTAIASPHQASGAEESNRSNSTIPDTLSPLCPVNECNSTILDNLSRPCAINDQSIRSTRSGPRTEAGKRRSSVNATRHGLAGRIVVLPSEDMSLYMEHSKELVDSLHPETPIERELALTVADGYWRMRRVRTVEEGMFAWAHSEPEGDFDADNENIHSAFTAAAAFRANSQAFVNLSIYEQRIQRGIEKAMKQLGELQARRKATRNEELLEAMPMRDYYKMEGLPNNPKADGFVCSTDEIELECLRRQRCEDARMASTVAFDYKEYLKKAA